ncbi:tetratricopeptide repeat-containing protein [Serratia proteamaculans]|jgi:regulator of sirC expression with transglutaminase-like and TPR domain|uniref:Tetratricopeptide repeat-containing protein n=1 Tax=Serratia proteamaculans TaxID=28151 RepID=A0A1W5DI67_SERPR|nr:MULTISPECIES: invasion regulator SirB1 [Serratia]HCV64039.1 tetratricopeptide repeat-containing protein [Serratia sp. (in: enterobacteria)]KAB1498131.1 tetratricopeptide repeat-containing protein [Serratia proteamaculans]MBI6180984.1 tetratricopeptide repeat-containing protein [Serratia proteamaculans]MBO1502885.1 tetratricopeptide repeat-containing protein [Serratia proteamaculans]MDW5509101.1 invasion regulator SirB1 [Serratia proteamaculans]
MSSIADFEFNTALLSAGVILVSQSVRRDFPTAEVERKLQQLVDDARAAMPKDLSQEQQLDALIELFFKTWGFGGAGGVYRLSDAIWLDKVLEGRQGTPVSLGTIFLHIAAHLDLPLLPVIFPTQLILRADWLDEEMWLINPLNGETLNEHQLEVWIKGNLGLGAELEDDDLDESENVMVVRKMLDTLKAALMEEKQMEMALRASETVLCFDPDDPYEIRDRGLIYAQLECNHIAISDLNYFVEQCPEDPVSEVIKVQIHSIEPKQVTLH